MSQGSQVSKVTISIYVQILKWQRRVGVVRNGQNSPKRGGGCHLGKIPISFCTFFWGLPLYVNGNWESWCVTKFLAALVALYLPLASVTATLEFLHKEWLLRLETHQTFDRGDELGRKSLKTSEKNIGKQLKKVGKSWKNRLMGLKSQKSLFVYKF